MNIGLIMAPRMECSLRQIRTKKCRHCGTVNEVIMSGTGLPQLCFKCHEPLHKSRRKV